MKEDVYWMEQALRCAKLAEQNGEVPVGAVLVMENTLIAEGWNQPIGQCDPSAHAEIVVLRQGAAKLENYRCVGATLYVSLEPCLMCAGAILQARISRLVFAAYDQRAGAVSSVYSVLQDKRLNHQVECEGGLLADRSVELLQSFFQQRR